MKYLRMKGVLVALLTLAALFASFDISFAADKNNLLRVTFLDVGQGDCIIVRTPAGKVIMIDAGDDTEYAAEKYIIPYLEANDIKKIDALVISHAHRDHIGGLLKVIPKVEIGAVYENKPSVSQVYAEIMQMFKKRNVPVYKSWQGDKLDFGDGIDTAVLHPSKEWYSIQGASLSLAPKNDDAGGDSSTSESEENLNNFSVVLRLQYKDIIYHFAGDAEKQAEDFIMKANPESSLPCNVYKVAHHGSKTSSDPSYLNKLKPNLSIISCGVDNKFKHPSASTVQNLKYYSKTTLRTDEDKTIETWTDGTEFHYSGNSTPNTVVSGPEVTDITPYSATINWETSHLSTTKVKYSEGSSAGTVKEVAEPVIRHQLTLTDLKPDTQYSFEIESSAVKDPSHILSAQGAFKTAPASASNVKITSVSWTPKTALIYEPVKFIVKTEGAPANSKLFFYESCISSKTLVSSETINSNGTASLNWKPQQSKDHELLFCVLSGDKVLAINSTHAGVTRRKVVIDTAHYNFNSAKFESFKVDLYGRGFEVTDNTDKITDATFKNASVFVISEYATNENGLNASEFTAIKKFVDNGGGLLLVSRADYGNYSQPQTLNKVLEQIGSNIRVNDDEALDPTNSPSGANMAYLLFMHLFDKKIIPAEVGIIICKGSASMLNSKMKPISAVDKTIIPLCFGDDDTYNIDSDNMGDGVICPKGSIVIDAAEILPSGGKVAAFGGFHIDSGAYSNSSSQQTHIYNYAVVNWLARPAKKCVDELSDEMAYINEDTNNAVSEGEFNQSSIIGASIRADKISKKLLDEFDYSNNKLESSIDNFIKFFNEGNVKNLSSFSSVIKKVLDRIRYEAAENPDLMINISPKINSLEELYNKSLKGNNL